MVDHVQLAVPVLLVGRQEHRDPALFQAARVAAHGVIVRPVVAFLRQRVLGHVGELHELRVAVGACFHGVALEAPVEGYLEETVRRAAGALDRFFRDDLTTGRADLPAVDGSRSADGGAAVHVARSRALSLERRGPEENCGQDEDGRTSKPIRSRINFHVFLSRMGIGLPRRSQAEESGPTEGGRQMYVRINTPSSLSNRPDCTWGSRLPSTARRGCRNAWLRPGPADRRAPSTGRDPRSSCLRS